MVDLASELLAAASKFPLWQRDALRRLALGPLKSVDLDELLQLALAEGGLLSSTQPPSDPPTANPIGAQHLTLTHSAGDAVVLSALHTIRGVNALEPTQRLEFVERGLTAVYGENGSGKSGYSRVLRKACRARAASTILPNVRDPAAATPQSASFDLVVSGNKVTSTWRLDTPAPEALARFAVFDRDCEHSFVDQQGAAAFIPPSLAWFDELTKAVDETKERIDALGRSCLPSDTLQDLSSKAGHLPAFRHVFEAAAPGKPDAVYQAGLEQLATATWSPEQEALLTATRQRVAESSSPVSRAKMLRSLASSVAIFRTSLEAISVKLDEPAKEKLASLVAGLDSAKKAAAVAAADLDFSSEPISGVGQSEWQALFQSAVRFARGNVEAIRAFPGVQAGSRCPLCAQELSAEAQARFARFQRFMAQDTRKAQEAATQALGTAREELERLAIPSLDGHAATQAIELVGQEVAGASLLSEISIKLAARRDALLGCIDSGDWTGAPALTVDAADLCRRIEIAIERQAAQSDALVDPRVRQTLVATVAELEGTKSVYEQSERVSHVLNQLRRAAALRRLASSISSRAISREGKAVAEKAVTAGLQAAFLEELGLLDAQALDHATISPRGEKGKTVYSLTLSAGASVTWHASQVLSEGEQRVIALAFFLAEARMAPSKVGLIIDDPVSSLDHRWADRIANRLTDLALERQVIVFTHSIAFLIELERYAAQKSATMAKLYLSRTPKGAGQCGAEFEPWEKLSIKARVSAFKKEVGALRALHQVDPRGRDYTRRAAALCGDLRAAWERAVEELVFATAIERFGYAVSTGRLRRAVCTEASYKFIHNAMTRLSAIIDAHDKARGAFGACPSPGDLDGFISDLEAFAIHQKTEADRVEPLRRALEGPVTAGGSP